MISYTSPNTVVWALCRPKMQLLAHTLNANLSVFLPPMTPQCELHTIQPLLRNRPRFPPPHPRDGPYFNAADGVDGSYAVGTPSPLEHTGVVFTDPAWGACSPQRHFFLKSPILICDFRETFVLDKRRRRLVLIFGGIEDQFVVASSA